MIDERYTLQELADAAGVSPRTVRYYIAEGLLPPPEPAGHKTSYSRDHLTRLKLIGLFKEAFLPLKEIRPRLAGIRDEDLERALAEAEQAYVSAGMETSEEQAPPRGPHRPPPAPARAMHRFQAPPPPIEPVDRDDEDAIAYIDRVLGKQRPLWTPPKPPREPAQPDKIWRRLAIGTEGEAELVISEGLYQRRKERIEALLVWAEKMLEQD